MAESVADLEILYNVDATFEYTSCRGLVRALRAFCEPIFLDRTSLMLDHTVLITRFPPQMFGPESEDVDNPVLRNGKALYFPDSQILIFTMPSCPHERLVRVIGHVWREKISRMNCVEELADIGGPTARLQNLMKEPDGSWGPAAVDYPTCVLEVEVSESFRQLDHDAHRWIENELSRVTQVVIVKIYPCRHEIIFAIWRKTASRRA
jgi:hypothetical protein